ncbi:PspC domain-containing protein [Actinomyces trachealis]|uniref:PspC domain-containing protein n=1 Tax=Actinomyces trachealis TaxID=2763540 RepID=UPI0018928AF7|nr:PspC domain-containing protein [Actinomyces trachealis]
MDMNFPSPPAPGPAEPQGTPHQPSSAPLGSFFDSIRRSGLFRGHDRWVGGVCSGLARRFDLDPVLVRVLVVVGTMFLGAGLLLYSLAWGLLPEEDDGRIHLESALQGEVSAGFAGACAGTLMGAFHANNGFLPNWYLNGSGMEVLTALVPLILLGLGIWVLVAWLIRPRRPSGGAPNGYQPPAAQAAPTHRGAAATAMSPEAAAPSTGPFNATAASASAVVPPYQRPAWQPTARPMPRPVRPPRPRVLGPERTISLLSLGLGLLVIAGCGWVAHVHGTRMTMPLVGLGALVLIIGLGVAVSGLRGRHGGWLSAVGALSLFAALPALALGAAVPASTLRALDNGFSQSRTITWAQLSDASPNSVEVGIGDVLVDLTDMPADATPRRLNLEVGVGNVQVILPQGRGTRVAASLGIGYLDMATGSQWAVDGQLLQQHASGHSYPDTTSYNLDGEVVHAYSYRRLGVVGNKLLTSPEATNLIDLHLEVGVGNVRVSERSADTTTWTGQVLKNGTWVVKHWNSAQGVSGNSVPVPGSDHPAITTEQSQICIDQAQRNPDTGDSTVEFVLGADARTYPLSSNEYKNYLQCVTETLKHGNLAQPDTTPSPEPSGPAATPSSSPASSPAAFSTASPTQG